VTAVTNLGRRDWTPLAERRGALAAALLLSLLCVLQVDISVCVMLFWRMPLILNGVRMAMGFLVLPLLGPGPWRSIAGTRPSAAAMLTGLGLGAFGVVLFTAYGFLVRYSFHAVVFPPVVSSFMTWCVHLMLVGPLVEEWLFRGVLWSAVRRRSKPAATIVITSAVFALSHGLARWLEFPCLFAFGVLLGVLRHRSGSLAPTILAHSLTNFGIVTGTSMLFTG
jgi:membrane protease YdiL (CAAX protease family)